MHTKEELYANKIFFNAALPLIKVIAQDVPSLKKQYEKVHAVIQVSALDPDAEGGKIGMHYVINGPDDWLIHLNKVDPKPHIELEFKSVEAMNAFFKGKISPATLPKMRGIAKHFGAFKAFLMTLLKMSSVLSATTPPEKEEDKQLMVKCMFYLLSSGISQLNNGDSQRRFNGNALILPFLQGNALVAELPYRDAGVILVAALVKQIGRHPCMVY